MAGRTIVACTCKRGGGGYSTVAVTVTPRTCRDSPCRCSGSASGARRRLRLSACARRRRHYPPACSHRRSAQRVHSNCSRIVSGTDRRLAASRRNAASLASSAYPEPHPARHRFASDCREAWIRLYCSRFRRGEASSMSRPSTRPSSRAPVSSRTGRRRARLHRNRPPGRASRAAATKALTGRALGLAQEERRSSQASLPASECPPFGSVLPFQASPEPVPAGSADTT